MTYQRFVLFLVVCFGILVGCAPAPDLAAGWFTPTTTAPPPDTPTPDAPLPTPTPLPRAEDWVLGNRLEIWQKQVLVEQVGQYWETVYAPAGLPNCQAAAGFWIAARSQTPLTYCRDWQAQGWYPKMMPAGMHEVYYFTYPNDGVVVVRLETPAEWYGEARYFNSENGLMRTRLYPVMAFDFVFMPEEGSWKLSDVSVRADGK